MKVDIKIRGIARRWLYNVMPLVLLVVIILTVSAVYLVNSYYIGLVAENVSTYTRTQNTLSLVTAKDFQNAAIEYIENFPHKDKVEIQIFDTGGEMIASTNVFSSATPTFRPDYNAAVSSTSGESVKRITLDTGEQCVAGTTVLSDLGNGSNGAYRFVVSIEKLLPTMYSLYALCFALGLAVIVFAWFSGQYFLRSIVNPVNEVTAAARKIASGDFDSRLEIKKADEIGALCDTINYMASELGQVEKAKNDFISSVSHELRTPLTAIRGWGETVMLSIGENDEIVKQGVDVIMNESERLSRLVEDLLDFSRMQNNRLSVSPEPTELKNILEASIEIYREAAKQKKVEMSFECPEKLPLVLADAGRIKQVFINIIDNAIKYSNLDGGSVVVTAVAEEGCIRVSVSDTGVGIRRSDLDRVKEKFYKANNNVRGSGIGLAVADEIIKQHNGLLFIESTEGEGTTVTVVLPTAVIQEEVTSVYFPPEEKSSQGELNEE